MEQSRGRVDPAKAAEVQELVRKAEGLPEDMRIYLAGYVEGARDRTGGRQ